MFKFRYASLFLSLAVLFVADSCNSRDVGSCGDVKTDTKNCGTCGHECNSGDFCVNGVCQSSCSQTTCKEGEKSLCVDLQNDANNCGSCGNKCGEDNLCEDGRCKSACDSPKFYCMNGENDAEKHCIDPASSDTCGVKNCEDAKTIARCEEGFVCRQTGGEYGCVCESAIVVESEKDGRTTKKCIDPSTDIHCGATADNPDGTSCGEGTICVDYQYTDSADHVQTGYHCTCAATWELSCYSALDASIACISTAESDDHCSANDCNNTSFACGADRKCKAGLCECSDNLVECNGECIDPLGDKNYCGAKGACTDDDATSDNYRGKKCGENEGCVNGECVCSNNSNVVSCDGKCIYMENTDTACTVTPKDDGSCDIVDCTKEGKVCKLNDETDTYYCGCPEGTVKCDGKCIDPKTDIHHCGAKGTCNSDFSDNNHYRGEDCSLRTDRNTLCVAGKCENECPDGQVDCNGECVKMDDYHVNDKCNDCIFSFPESKFYCYPGDRDKNNNIINFDYHKCLMKDAAGNDLNKLGSKHFCGVSCTDYEECKNGKHCDNSNKCVCDDNIEILCPAKKSEHESTDDEKFCINKKDTHQVDCGVCEEGWADADGDLLNGCEINTKNDVKNCGAIGNNCIESVQNATGIFCNQGKCDYAYCTEDHGDCDGERTNGCEQSGLASDSKHCGACGRVCEGGSCVNSVCCDGNGKTAAKADDLNCCNGLNKYRYTHSSWNEDKACTDVSHYSCLSANPNEACWQVVE